MGSRRPTIPRRTRIFMGCEGKCEIPFIAWLQKVCDAGKTYKHLDEGAVGGGDTLAIVEKCVKLRSERRVRRGAYAHSFIILDKDRLAGDGQRGQQAIALAQKEGFILVFSKPNFEGLLLRFFDRHEQDDPPANRTLDELLRLWPNYRKPPIAVELEKRFTVVDLKRAARFDDDFAALLQVIGLL